jgi:hypothetical protein
MRAEYRIARGRLWRGGGDLFLSSFNQNLRP